MNASSKIRSKTAHGDCCSTVKRGTDQYGNGVCIMPRRPTCSETILPRKPYCRAHRCSEANRTRYCRANIAVRSRKRPHLTSVFCSFKKTTMSLTAMTRELARLEASIESNQAPSGIGIELSDPAEFESLSPIQSGALCWDCANGGSETPVVSQTSFGCPGPT